MALLYSIYIITSSIITVSCTIDGGFMNKTYIVAESGADLLKSDVENNDIRIVPMHVTFDDTCLDDGCFPVCKIFEYYNHTKQLPKTSATNPYEYQNIFEKY